MGVATVVKVWVFEPVPNSLELKNIPISFSFYMNMLRCGRSSSLCSVWCFAIGTLSLVLCFSFPFDLTVTGEAVK